jgi:hypothetical protein
MSDIYGLFTWMWMVVVSVLVTGVPHKNKIINKPSKHHMA